MKVVSLLEKSESSLPTVYLSSILVFLPQNKSRKKQKILSSILFLMAPRVVIAKKVNEDIFWKWNSISQNAEKKLYWFDYIIGILFSFTFRCSSQLFFFFFFLLKFCTWNEFTRWWESFFLHFSRHYFQNYTVLLETIY